MAYVPWTIGTGAINPQQVNEEQAWNAARRAERTAAAAFQRSIDEQRAQTERIWREHDERVRRANEETVRRTQEENQRREREQAVAWQREQDQLAARQRQDASARRGSFTNHTAVPLDQCPPHYRWERTKQGEWVKNRYGNSAIPFGNGTHLTDFQLMQQVDNGKWAWVDIDLNGPTVWQQGPPRIEEYRLRSHGKITFNRPCGSPSYFPRDYREVIRCPKDHQALRVPVHRGKIRVACPCGHKWEWSPF